MGDSRIVQQLKTVLEVSLAFAHEKDLDLLLDMVVQKAVAITAAERGALILLPDVVTAAGEFRPSMILRATHNLDAREIDRISSTAIRRVLESGEPAAWVDVSALSDEELASAASVRLGGVRFILCAPLRTRGAPPLGALYVDSQRPALGTFDESDLDIFSSLAAQAAVAIENGLLHQQVITDPLTGVHSRGYFDHCLQVTVQRAVSKQQPAGLLLADVNQLHDINEGWGYDAGDGAIRQLAALMRLRATDSTFRLGGDEFGGVFPETTREQVETIRQRVADASQRLTDDFAQTQQGQPWFGVGLGVAVAPEDADTAQGLYNAADDNMNLYRGRSRRKVQYTVGEPPPRIAEAQLDKITTM